MKFLLKSIILSSAAILPNVAVAQEAAPSSVDQPPLGGLEEIIVTAQRRSERLQDVPIAVTAVTANRLAATRIENATDLAALTPSLTVPATQAYFQPRIRGVGTLAFGPGIENPVATYIDGVYLAQANSSLLSFTDVERVEVLKGPQGTLFGRNATGGLIQILTRDPTPGLSGLVNFSYGNYERVMSDVSITGGSDTLSGIVSGFYRYQGDGYGTNFATGQDTNRQTREYGARAKIMFSPTDSTVIRLSGDYVHSEGTYPDLRAPKGEKPLFGSAVPGTVWDTTSDYQSHNRYSGGGVTLNVQQGLGELRLTSITAYRTSKYQYNIDYDLTPNPFLKIANVENNQQISQELQLGSGPGSRISWLIGGYFFHFKGEFDPSTISFAGPVVGIPPLTSISLDGNQKGTSYAAFGQVTIPLGEKTRLTGGLRYNTEHRTLKVLESLSILGLPAAIDLPFTDGATFNKLTFRLALDHKITPDILAYASFNRGFKSGGFNILTPDEADYKPETLDAYEVGFKMELFDRKLRINPAFFYYRYDNLQLPFFTASGQVGLANGPSAKLYGADLDFEIAPTANFRIFGGASFIHDRFGTYTDAVVSTPLGGGAYLQSLGDATGNQLPFTAKFSGNVGVEYNIPTSAGKFTFSGNYAYNDGYFLEVDNKARQGHFDQLSGSIGWSADESRLLISVWGKNLTNSEIYTQFATAPQGRAASYQPPRTYGVTIGTKF